MIFPIYVLVKTIKMNKRAPQRNEHTSHSALHQQQNLPVVSDIYVGARTTSVVKTFKHMLPYALNVSGQK